MTSPDDVIRQIDEVRFTPTRIREGYAMGEVDAFLDELINTAQAGVPLEQVIGDRTFTVVSWREGYDRGDVDAFLARLNGQPLPEAPPSGPDEPQMAREQRSLWARLLGKR